MADIAILNVSKKYKQSIGKLTCLNNEVDVCAPYDITNCSDEQVMGSGFFIKSSDLYLPKSMAKNRYLITNAHVVEGVTHRRIQISFPHLGDTKLWGKVMLACRSLDFSIVEVTAENNTHLQREIGQSFAEVFKTIPFVKVSAKPVNTSKELAKSIIAMGYPLDSHDCHISTGKISGKHECYLQVNCSINSGNSGGALFNEEGICIGINAASFEGSEGVTLAVEWAHVSTMLKHYWSQSPEDYVVYPPMLGIITKKLIDSYANTKLRDTTIKGALVSHLFPNTPLSKVKVGDVVMAIGDHHYEFDIDRSGNVTVPFQHDKVKFYSLNVLLLLDPSTCFVRVYSNNRQKTCSFKLTAINDIVKRVMPALENIPCCAFGGMIVTQLTKNHMESLESGDDLDPHIINFFTKTHGSKKAIVASNFHIPCSILEQGYNVKKLTIIQSIDNQKVQDVDTFKAIAEEAILNYSRNKCKKTRYLEMKLQDETVIVDLELVCQTEPLLEMCPNYPKQLSVLAVLKNPPEPARKRRKRHA